MGYLIPQGNIVVKSGANRCEFLYQTILVELDYMKIPGLFRHAHKPTQVE